MEPNLRELQIPDIDFIPDPGGCILEHRSTYDRMLRVVGIDLFTHYLPVVMAIYSIPGHERCSSL